MKSKINIRSHTKEIKDRLKNIGRDDSVIDLSSVIRDIPRVRRSGQKPDQTIGDIDLFSYECELCLLKVKEGDLTQCPYCGRWICKKDCYSTGEGSCVSCESVIRLKRESIIHIKDLMNSMNKSDNSVGKVKLDEQEN